MQQRYNAVVFIGMVYPGGLIRHFALLGIELEKATSTFDFYFASINREPDGGTWQLVRRATPPESLIAGDTFDDVVSRIDALFGEYEKVLVHCGGGWGQTRKLAPLRRKYGRRLVLVGTTHSYRIESSMRVLMSIFQLYLYVRYYDKIVFQCKYAASHFCGARLLFAANKGTIIPLGCESFDGQSQDIPNGIESKPSLARLLLDKQLFKFVYLAGFRPGKMHVWLVNAMASVLKRHPDVIVLFCGKGERSVIDSTITAIRNQNLESQIILPGQIMRSEVPWLLKHCNCAIVPSRAETFGHNFLEPMFAGLPVLGTRVGVGCDIIVEGETGYSFSLDNTKSVQYGVERLLSDRERVNAMGMNAKRLVEQNYSHTVVAKRLTELYTSLLKC